MAEITRNEFLKCCTLGACSCFAVSAALPASALAEPSSPEAEWLKSQIDAAKIRHAKMVEVLDRDLDASTRDKILESVGRECAKQFRDSTYGKFQGDLDGFLKLVQGPNGWVTKAEYDEAAGTLRIVDKSSRCTCPLVKAEVTPPSQCNCTLGWQKEAYSYILGHPVEASVEESVLRGGKKCVFRIKTK